MNITDFLKDKKPLDKDRLNGFIAEYDRLISTENNYSFERDYRKALAKKIAESLYDGFDMKFFHQTKRLLIENEELTLPKYALHDINDNYLYSIIKICLIPISPIPSKAIGFTYISNDKIRGLIELPLPDFITDNYIKAMVSDDAVSIPKLATPNHYSYAIKNFFKHGIDIKRKLRKELKNSSFMRDGESVLVSSAISVIDDDSRAAVDNARKYFINQGIFAVAEANWSIRENTDDDRNAHKRFINEDDLQKGSFPVLGFIDDCAYMIAVATPEDRPKLVADMSIISELEVKSYIGDMHLFRYG